MPIFEYECGKCGRLFEELVASAAEKVCCPSCGSDNIEKLFSAFAKNCGSCGSSGGHT
jgi:putative FmdB family regulatory protein